MTGPAPPAGTLADRDVAGARCPIPGRRGALEASGGDLDPAAPDAAPVAGGWNARLRLCFAPRQGKTVLAAKRQLGPLTVQRPFYPEGDVCHVYLLHPPGGVVGGDDLRLDVGVGQGARVLVTTPGAGKFYRSGERVAAQRVGLEIGPDGVLEWLPQESILFDGARVRVDTRVDLHPRARFLGWELYCLGRPACGERFAHGRADLRLAVYRGDRPLLAERLRLKAGDRLDGSAGLRGHPFVGTLVATGADAASLEAARGLLPPPHRVVAGATLLEDLLVVRCLGRDGEDVTRLLRGLWSVLRPSLLGRPAAPPRIWAT
jgi:urease accessory protein